jgi:hypothetical protein
MKDLTLRLLDQRNAHIFGKSPLRFSSLYFCLSKFCYRCGSLKSLDQFNKSSGKKYGKQAKCKQCQSDIHQQTKEIKAAKKLSKIKNDPEYKARHLATKRRHNKKSINRHRAYCIEWNKQNKKSRHESYIRYKNKNLELFRKKHRERVSSRMKSDPLFKLTSRLRSQLLSILKKTESKKSSNTFKLTGCTPAELRKHLESQFTEGMNWSNQGEWHLDHIIPCSKFDLNDEYQQRICFHWTNLQPLWAADNIRKGNYIKPGSQPNLPI